MAYFSPLEVVQECVCDFRYRDCPGGLTCVSSHWKHKPYMFFDFGWGEGPFLSVRISDTHPYRGLSLWAVRTFRKGDAITVYDGHLVPRSLGAQASHLSLSASMTHVMAINDYMVFALVQPLA